MLDAGIVSRDRDEEYPADPYHYSLKGSGLKWLTDPRNRRHEMACGDLFVAYSKQLTWWDLEWTTEERKRFQIPEKRGIYDRRMMLASSPFQFMIELERGTKEIFSEADRFKVSKSRWERSVNGKIDAYREFSKKNPGLPYKVLLIVKHTSERKYPRTEDDYGPTTRFADQILELLTERSTGSHFLVARHADVMANPYGSVFANPADPKHPVSLLDLTASRTHA